MNTPHEPRNESRDLAPHADGVAEHVAEHLEKLIGQVLREQPPRRAPSSLESRVLAAIEAKIALPWWRMSFGNWPVAARVAFLLVSIGIVKASLSAVMWLFTDERSAPVVSAIQRPLSWAESISDFGSATARVCAAVLHAVPTQWLYAGIAIAAALYIALFVLGATAYRTLYVNK